MNDIWFFSNYRRDKDVIGILEDIAEASLADTKFFHTGPEPTWYALNGDVEWVDPKRKKNEAK